MDATILIILMGDIAWLGAYLGAYHKIRKHRTSNGNACRHLFDGAPAILEMATPKGGCFYLRVVMLYTDSV